MIETKTCHDQTNVICFVGFFFLFLHNHKALQFILVIDSFQEKCPFSLSSSHQEPAPTAAAVSSTSVESAEERAIRSWSTSSHQLFPPSPLPLHPGPVGGHDEWFILPAKRADSSLHFRPIFPKWAGAKWLYQYLISSPPTATFSFRPRIWKRKNTLKKSWCGFSLSLLIRTAVLTKWYNH